MLLSYRLVLLHHVILGVVVNFSKARDGRMDYVQSCSSPFCSGQSRAHRFKAAGDVFADEARALGGGRQAVEVGGGHRQPLSALQLHAREVAPRVAHPICHHLAQQAVPRDRHQPEPAQRMRRLVNDGLEHCMQRHFNATFNKLSATP